MYEDFIDTISKNDFRGFNSLEYSDGVEGSGQELYVSFKTILRFTAENLNLFTGTAKSTKKQIITIDWESDKPMFMFSTSVSCNLQKCYIRNSLLKTSIGTLYSPSESGIAPFSDIDHFYLTKLNTLRDGFRTASNTTDGIPAIYPSIGNINNIYLNVNFLVEVLIKESDNEDGKVSIREYLQALCNGVNKALGSINDLQVVIDEDAPIPYVTIIDYQQKRIKGLGGLLSNNNAVTTLKGQGLGSMLTNISAQSSITPDVATMISIGAQAQGAVLGEEAVSFSRLSAGLTDRVYPQKFITELELEKAAKIAADRKEQAAARFQVTMNTYAELVNLQTPASLYGPIKLTSDLKTDYENIATDFYKYLLAEFTETNQTATALIPVKLSFNMHGIGGMKMYQKFKISDDILPLSYTSEYEFIAMGISHTVDSSKWDTAVSATISIASEEIKLKEAFSVPLLAVEVSSGASLVNNNVKPLTNAERISNVQKIARYLKSIKITKEGATGLIGNILGESQANEKAAEKNRAIGGLGGIGIVQWTNVRRRALEKAANSDNSKVLDLDFQLAYLGGELKKLYPGVLNVLTTTTSIETATVTVLEKFEVPGTYLARGENPTAYQATKQKRYDYALSVKDIVADIYKEVT